MSDDGPGRTLQDREKLVGSLSKGNQKKGGMKGRE
jgi:hypothetical protein